MKIQLTSSCAYHIKIASLRGLPFENDCPNESSYRPLNSVQHLSQVPVPLCPSLQSLFTFVTGSQKEETSSVQGGGGGGVEGEVDIWSERESSYGNSLNAMDGWSTASPCHARSGLGKKKKKWGGWGGGGDGRWWIGCWGSVRYHGNLNERPLLIKNKNKQPKMAGEEEGKLWLENSA